MDDYNNIINAPENIEFIDSDGIFKVDGDFTAFKVSLFYDRDVNTDNDAVSIATLTFRTSNGDCFDGGDGTAENPYLISNIMQFKKISEGLDKHPFL